jgi:hypothetical protein
MECSVLQPILKPRTFMGTLVTYTTTVGSNERLQLLFYLVRLAGNLWVAAVFSSMYVCDE